MGREEEIKLIAYRIWEDEDHCHGRDVEHWLKAEMKWEQQQKQAVAASRNTKTQIKHIGEKSKQNMATKAPR
jgi:hypothetical protein